MKDKENKDDRGDLDLSLIIDQHKKEIWTLVHYIRKFQDPEYGKKDTTKPEQSNSSDVDIIKDTITVNNSM